VVCLSVGLSVTVMSGMSPAKTAEPMEMQFGLWTRMGSRNHVLHEGPDPPWEEAILRTEGRPIAKYMNTVYVRRRCGLLSNYFDQLLLVGHAEALARCGLLLQKG